MLLLCIFIEKMEVEEVIARMNEMGAKKEPFIFGIDYEKRNGFIWDHPLTQHQVYWRIGDVGNYQSLPMPTQSGSFFKALPIPESVYKVKFDLVHRELMRGNSFLLNLTVKTPILTDYSFEEIFKRSNAHYNILWPGKFVCFSPEIFIKIEGNQIFSYPMKGTINAAIDNAEQVILDSYKERSEHFTIVDFIRNDLGMVANRIQVDRLRYLDRLFTTNGEILQVSSQISGTLQQGWETKLGSILSELLPAGSISGAPKESSVEIIKRAEQEKRGYYTGVFGYFDGKSLDSAVMIRFMEIENDEVFFRSGGGITINSDAQSEYCEVIEKAYLPF